MGKEFYHGEEYLEGRPAPNPAYTWWPKPSQSPPALPFSLVAANYLNSRRLSVEIAAANGWYSVEASDGVERICIPCLGEEWAYWQSRAVEPSQGKRYMCPSWKRGGAYCRVYPTPIVGIPPKIYPTVAVVEGPLDALAAAGETVVGIAMLGLHPPPDALANIVQETSLYPTRLLILDNDPEARKRGPDLVTLWGERHVSVELRFPPSPWKDLADCPPPIRSILLRAS